MAIEAPTTRHIQETCSNDWVRASSQRRTWLAIGVVVAILLLDLACDSNRPGPVDRGIGDGSTDGGESGTPPNGGTPPPGVFYFTAVYRLPDYTYRSVVGEAPYESPEEFRLLGDEGGNFAGPVVSPNGRFVFIMDGIKEGNGYLLDRLTDSVQGLTRPGSAEPSRRVQIVVSTDFASWSPDSDWLIYTNTGGVSGGSNAVHRYDLDAQEEELSSRTWRPIATLSVDTLLVWGRPSADRPFGVYLLGSEFDWSLHAANSLLDSRHPELASWNSSDRLLAYTYYDGAHRKIAIASLDGVKNRDFEVTTRDAWHPVWGPPGHLLFTEGDMTTDSVPRTIWDLDVRTGSIRPLLGSVDIEGAVAIETGSYGSAQ